MSNSNPPKEAEGEDVSIEDLRAILETLVYNRIGSRSLSLADSEACAIVAKEIAQALQDRENRARNKAFEELEAKLPKHRRVTSVRKRLDPVNYANKCGFNQALNQTAQTIKQLKGGNPNDKN